MEDLALDRCALDHRALVGPSRSRRARERLDRRRDRDGLQIAGRHPVAVLAVEQAVVDEHPEHLLDEERVALGRAVTRSWTSGRLSPAQEVRTSSPILLAQRLEQDRRRVELAAAPAGRSSSSSGRARQTSRIGRRATSRRCARRGRGTSARPIAGRRRRRRAAVRAPAPRTASGRPRRSRRGPISSTGRAPRRAARRSALRLVAGERVAIEPRSSP